MCGLGTLRALHCENREDGFGNSGINSAGILEKTAQLNVCDDTAVAKHFTILNALQQGLVLTFAGDDFPNPPIEHGEMQFKEGKGVREQRATGILEADLNLAIFQNIPSAQPEKFNFQSLMEFTDHFWYDAHSL